MAKQFEIDERCDSLLEIAAAAADLLCISNGMGDTFA